MEPNSIPEVKRILRSITMRESEEFAQQLLGLSKIDEIRQLLSDYSKKFDSEES